MNRDIQQDIEDEEPSLTIVCSGDPYCELRGDACVKAQEQGCPWCSYVYTYEDGRDEIKQPGIA